MDNNEAVAGRIAAYLPRYPPVANHVADRLRAARLAAIARRRALRRRNLILAGAGGIAAVVFVVKIFNW